MKRYFCTLFDSGYLFKGAVMLTSLKKHCPEATVFVLCLDELASDILNSLQIEGCICIPLAQVESDALLEAKSDRNIAEYCWTLSSNFTAWLMDNRPEVDLITYLDADLMFFSTPEPLFDELKNASIGIIEHRFIPRLQHLESKGRFCVEWVSFRRDDQGLACLYRWRDQCLEWCYDRLEDGRMGDQKYLDTWPNDYLRTRVLEHLGAGVAPWNYSNYTYGQSSEGQLRVGEVPLIFFHFHQFQLIDDGSFYRLSPYYAEEASAPELIYGLYESAMRDMVRTIQTHRPEFSKGMKSHAQVYSRRWIQTYVPRSVKELLKKFIRY
jgi:hypothetical protein